MHNNDDGLAITIAQLFLQNRQAKNNITDNLNIFFLKTYYMKIKQNFRQRFKIYHLELTLYNHLNILEKYLQCNHI